MGRLIGPPITESDKIWLLEKRIFFTASAPLHKDHHVNVSPKSGKELRIINNNTVCYLDYSGSGSETAAHIYENKRLTLLFCAFDGPPKIIRMFGKGEIILPYEIQNNDKYKHISKLYDENDYNAGFRSIVLLNVDRISSSCGFTVPEFNFIKNRSILEEKYKTIGIEGMKDYRGFKNSFSIDGLKSIGQIEMNKLPTEMKLESGYYFGYYNQNIYNKFIVQCKMIFHKGLIGLQRDLLMIFIGFILCYTISYMGYNNKDI
jgi:hypothetical protein